MNNHFNHISLSEKLKAKTLKKAKSINWVAIYSIAAALVVTVGISAFALPHVFNGQKNGAAPENNLYASNYENDMNQEASDIVNKGNDGYQILDEADDIPEGAVILTDAPNPQTPAPDIKMHNVTNTPEVTKSPVTGSPIAVTTPDTIFEDIPETTSPPSSTPVDGYKPPVASTTSRPDNYDETINANRETMYVTADNVAAHDRASTDAPVKFTIPKGAQVIADRNFQRIWAYVHYEENGVTKYGFVLEEYLSTAKP